MASPLVQGKEIWSRLQMTQRLMVVGAALGTIALIVALVFYYSGEEYSLLFSDLKASDAQAIVEKLKASNVGYKLSNNGTSISVPSNRVSELRLQMASSGVLSGGHVGFDLFDKASFGATDFAQQVNYQRAIEGELARTLEGMEEVESARVHITKAHESIYADKEEKAKASVMLRVRQNRELSNERTDSVVSLVASAVEGLDPSDVSVMDSTGRLLTSGKRYGQNDAGAFNSQLDAKRKLEAETAARIVSLIEPISGAGRVRADVAADVDFSKVEQTEEKYDPRSQVVRSQQTTQEVRNNKGGITTAGVTGARANDPATATPNQTNTTNNGDSRNATTTNYEIDKIVKHTIGNDGRITRLSASVVVDHKVVNGVSVARSPEELKKLQEVISAAIGIDTNRGDQIVVQTMPFDQPVTEVATNASWLQKNRELINTLVKYLAPVLLVLLFLFFVVRPAKKALMAALNHAPQLLSASASGAPLALPAASLTEAERAAEQLSPRTVAEMEAALNGKEIHSHNKAEGNHIDEMKQELVARIKEDPDLMAMTVRSWLNEEN